ncbi:hypothetical protein F2Q68_00005555 [Brassica cretica]|uniref:Serine aminopeptidase S33 domain-containing protein n=1 Tax=Brassica cretica TaxID=69181 RepID=A0A8S9JMS2_BRACR|nr:hypothetical protein F2Q68_00005555 [Brassica cretica]
MERSKKEEEKKIGFRIQNSHNEKLVVLLHETGSREVVVLCHGFKSDKNNTILKNVAAAIEKEGISAFRFDFSGNGESEGGFNYGNYKYEADADDLHSVIQHFSNTLGRPDLGQAHLNIGPYILRSGPVNTNHVVTTIIGHSRGGNVVLQYASKYCNDGNVRSVISISGRYDLKKGIRLGDG